MPSVDRIVAADAGLPVRLSSAELSHATVHVARSGRRSRGGRDRDLACDGGDHVVADQPLVSVETDKAVVEVPSPRSGRIARLFGAKGDVVKVGAPAGRVCRGRRAGYRHRRRRARRQREATAVAEACRASAGRKLRCFRRCARWRASSMSISTRVEATGPDGTITRADVERAARSLADAGPAEPLRGMRRAMAQRMAAAHAEVVPASVTDDADIDDWRRGEDATIRLVRAIAAACKAEPRSMPGTMPARANGG